jgi:hypothetical protein
MRIFMCPAQLSPEDCQVLSAIYAGPDSTMELVLHELIWNDWFKDVPILDILPPEGLQGLLITPNRCPPWRSSRSRYGRHLYDRTTRVQSMDGQVMRLCEVPIYLAWHVRNSMREFDAEHHLYRWLQEHRGAVLLRPEIWDDCFLKETGPEDYAAMRAAVPEILEVARQCSPVWCKW